MPIMCSYYECFCKELIKLGNFLFHCPS